VQQYVAASGGERALDRVKSMYAMGKVRMTAAEQLNGSDAAGGHCGGATGKGNRGGRRKGRGGEVGGFVLWQKRPELWCLELVVSGCKISAGSDGKVAWRQTPWHQSHASRGPPRPLRRSLQVRSRSVAYARGFVYGFQLAPHCFTRCALECLPYARGRSP
jgi:hypothetical protein